MRLPFSQKTRKGQTKVAPPPGQKNKVKNKTLEALPGEVGTVITDRPPRRTGRALLRHPAPRSCMAFIGEAQALAG